MIINFSVQNFRSIKDRVTLSFEASKSNHLEAYYIAQPIDGLRLLKLGMIYGSNASGKTTVLAALEFLRTLVIDPLRSKNDRFDYKSFQFDGSSIHENSFFTLEFVHKQVRYLYELEMNNACILNESLHCGISNKTLIYKRSTVVESQLAKIEFGSNVNLWHEHKGILESHTLWNNTVLGGFMKANISFEELFWVCQWFSLHLAPLVSNKHSMKAYILKDIEDKKIDKASVISLLNKADYNISDFKIGKTDDQQLMFSHSVSSKQGTSVYELPYTDESQGTQRYFDMVGLLLLLVKNNIVMMIDELDTSLHPDLYNHFLSSFLTNSKESQLIITTHFREYLINKNLYRNDAIWFTEKQDDGSTDLFSLNDFDDSEVQDDHTSMYNAYKIGKFGAMPNLQDYDMNLNE